MNRYKFEILSCLSDKEGMTWRELSDETRISGATVNYELKKLIENKYVNKIKNRYKITFEGIDILEPYRAKKAIIFAAGFGSRMLPVTANTPKPLVEVNGIRIIDRLLDALINKGISDITIVIGYLKDKFYELKEKYPNIKFIYNDKYESENNISSAILAKEEINGCYICAGDLLVSNPDIIKKYHYRSNYLASYVIETDDWCFDVYNGIIRNYRKGGEFCYNQYEITYWNEEDCEKLKEHWVRAYGMKEGKELFWEFIPLSIFKDLYEVEVRACSKEDIMEIDNYYELAELDSKYMI